MLDDTAKLEGDLLEALKITKESNKTLVIEAKRSRKGVVEGYLAVDHAAKLEALGMIKLNWNGSIAKITAEGERYIEENQ